MRSRHELGRRFGAGRLAAVAVGTIALGAVAAVAWKASITGSAQGPALSGTIGSPAPPASDARLVITPRQDRMSAAPDRGITVRAVQGTIRSVHVRTDGDPVTGKLSHGRTRWHSAWALDTATSYTVRATAVDASGRAVTATTSFRTLTPKETFSTQIFEGYHRSYGVGMPVILQFSRPIENKRTVERSLQLWTSHPISGAWYWDGDQTLYFRPRTYWRPQTQVRFVGHLNGIQGAPGVYGVHTLTQSFHIGRSLIAVGDTQTHHVQIYLDKKPYAVWPMSSGRPGDDTPDGTYLTIDKSNPEDMVGPGYNIEVPWSVRFTWSGDFMHDAYWSVNQQGFENVSHGCVNLSPANAEWYYKHADPGDPVTITGSPKAGTWGNGWTVWFLGWRDLVAGNALHEAVRVGPKGSVFVKPSTLPPVQAKAPLRAPRPGNSDASS